MGFSLTIEEDDAELIISTMADALRAANKDADKYHDMNEQTGSERSIRYQCLLEYSRAKAMML